MKRLENDALVGDVFCIVTQADFRSIS